MNKNSSKELFFLSLVKNESISIDENGKVLNNITKKEIGYLSNKGYKVIGWRIGRKTVTQLVHRLVHIIYNEGFTEEEPICNHKDGNKLNNHFSNLEKTTHSKNTKHAFDLGLRVITEQEKLHLHLLNKGEKAHNSKITDNQAKIIREKYSSGLHTHRSIAEEFNMHHSTIGSILRKETFK